MATNPRFTPLALAASALACLPAPPHTPADELTPPPIKPLYVPLFAGVGEPPPAEKEGEPLYVPFFDRYDPPKRIDLSYGVWGSAGRTIEFGPTYERPDLPYLGLRNLRRQSEGSWGSLSSSTVLRDPGAGPERASFEEEWRTEQALRLQLYGPLFAFGQVGAGSKQAAAEELKVSGRTGVGCKLPSLFGAEMQLRGGSQMTCTDPQRPERLKEHSEFLFEVQYRQPLFGRIGLEYQGTAVPALDPTSRDPTSRDRLDQDLGLAMPVGGAGKLRLGAKHRWENLPTPKPGADGMQLYLGLELGR
jgi:hypothetical protein